MNEKTVNNLFCNFKKSDWCYNKSKTFCIYNEDFDLEIKLKNKMKRSEDEHLSGKQWNDLFSKYPSAKLIDIVISYKAININEFTYLDLGDIIIPLPIAANRINDFYKNELNIARTFSDNEVKFDNLISNFNKIKK
jgi:hypothetical protein